MSRTGKFELTSGEEEGDNSSWPGTEEESGLLQLRMSEVLEPRLVSS
jgi:hypothetical protein